jgi:hypothetical protein
VPRRAYVPPHRRVVSKPDEPLYHIKRAISSEYVWNSLKADDWAIGVIAFISWVRERASAIKCIRTSCGMGRHHEIDDNASEHPCILLGVSDKKPDDKELYLNVVMTSTKSQPLWRRKGIKCRSFLLNRRNTKLLDNRPREYCVEHTLWLESEEGPVN